MKRRIAMIPVRMGSQRVPKKNLRMLAGKPLVAHIIESAKAAEIFDAIYLNSESDIFGEIARDYGINFYKRPAELASNSATNDDFALDFMEQVQCETLIQLLCTSPFLSPREIRDFCDHMESEKLDTLISVENHQIESIHEGRPINFDGQGPTLPSQQLKPVQSYACSIMGWDCKTFKNNMKTLGAGYHGGTGRTGYFTLKGYSTIDIDNEEDFTLAEVVAKALAEEKQAPQYYGSDKEHAERDVQSILAKDGIANNDLEDANHTQVNVLNMIEERPSDQSWSKRIVNTESNCMTLISQQPGEGNRRHYHPNWNEWWYILKGEWSIWIEGRTITARVGDVIFIPKNTFHQITASGTESAVRMAVSRADVDHVYRDE